MTQDELSVLAQKLKDKTITKEEAFAFYEELNKLLSEMKTLLEEK